MSVTATAAQAQPERPTLEPVVYFDAVYRDHFPFVWRNLRRWGVAESALDDVAQDVFVVVYQRLDSFRGGSLRAWLFAILVRVAGDHRRSARYRDHAPLPDQVGDPRAPSPGRDAETRESVALLHDLLRAMDEPKRTAFILADLEEMSASEISEVLDENLNTVYSRLRAARRELERALERRRLRELGWKGGTR